MSTTSNLNFRGRGMSRGYRNNRSMTPPSPSWRNDYYQQQPLEAPQEGRGAFRGGARLYRRENARGRQWSGFYGDERCGKCGRQCHAHPNMCPAINLDCRGCGKKGHFLRMPKFGTNTNDVWLTQKGHRVVKGRKFCNSHFESKKSQL